MAEGGFVYRGTKENFADLVLDNSRRGPVLVHFWAPWAGPCLRSMPQLEQWAREYAGGFLLVHVNTDEQRPLAREYGIRSVPTLKLFRDAAVLDTVYGGQTEAVFRAWIDPLVAPRRRMAHAAALGAYRSGDLRAALELLAEVTTAEPGDPQVAVHRAKLLIQLAEHSSALAVLRKLPEPARQDPDVTSLLGHLELIDAASEGAPVEELELRIRLRPDDLQARFELAAQRAIGDELEGCLGQLLEIVRRDRGYRGGAAHRAVLALLAMLGENDELAQRYRGLLGQTDG